MTVGRCPLCGERGVTLCGPLAALAGAELRECAAGHAPVLLSWPWESEAAYAEWYANGLFHVEQQAEEGFRSYLDLERDAEFRRVARWRLKFLEALRPEPYSAPNTPSLLDVGAGSGAFVHEARLRGYGAFGFEPCGDLVRRWHEACFRPLVRGGWEDARPAWDVVTLHDVLEHLTAPEACLRHLRECLRPDGLLAVEMPECAAPDPAWTRHVRPRQHLCLFSREAAEALYARAGLEVELFLRPVRGTLAKMVHYLRAR